MRLPSLTFGVCHLCIPCERAYLLTNPTATAADREKPTPRAITERLVKIRQMSKKADGAGFKVANSKQKTPNTTPRKPGRQPGAKMTSKSTPKSAEKNVEAAAGNKRKHVEET